MIELKANKVRLLADFLCKSAGTANGQADEAYCRHTRCEECILHKDNNATASDLYDFINKYDIKITVENT